MEETEAAQLQGIFNNMNAVADHQRKLAEQAKKPSLEECEDCGEEIPEARRIAVPGVAKCILCQTKREKFYAP